MKQHTSNFKDELINHGKQQEVQITFNNTTLTGENINSVTPNYKGGLIKSVMKGLDIDSNVEIPAGTEINFRYGLLIGNNYEYLDFGNYIVYSVEKQKDVDSYKIIAYDKMLLAMKEYEHIEVQYPCSVLTYLDALCQQIGLSLGTSTFPNYLQNMEREYFMSYNERTQEWESLGYTYRDVLDDIAEVTGSTLYVKTVGDNEILYVGQPTETSEVINENYFKAYDVNIGEKYGPINSVVLSRLGVDNIYSRDEQSIEQNGLYEIKITDNQIMNDNNRDRFLPGIYDTLHGMEFYLNDLESIGIVYLDLLDRYTIQIGEELYSCVMFGDEIEITQGLEEHIYTDEPESSETDYSKADKTDRRINETSLIVDKQNQQITAAVTNSTEALSQVTSLDVRVGTLESEIKTIADLTVTASGYGSVQFDEDEVATNLSEPAFIKVYPVTYDIELLRPNAYLTPNTWYKHISINGTTTTQTITPIAPRSRKLKFTNMDTDEVFYFELPADLYYLSDSVYDTFIYDYQNDQCYIERKVNAIWNNGVLEKSALTSSVIETYTMPHDTVLTEGYYKVELLSYQTAYISITLLAKNIYTDQFALKAEMNSAITQTAEQIETSVSETYATKNELNTQASRITQNANSITAEVTNRQNADDLLNSRITQNANSITAEVTNRQNADSSINASLQLKVDKDDNNQVVSMINASANRITLNSNRLVVNSDKFKVAADGTITATNGNFSGTVNATSGSFTGSINSSNATITGGSVHVKSSQANEQLISVAKTNDSNKYSFMSYDLIGVNAGQMEYMFLSPEEMRVAGPDGSFLWDGYNGNLRVSGTVSGGSDKRWKHAIKNTKIKALDIINKIKHREFKWNKTNKKVSVGYIAQEVEKIDKELVTQDDKGFYYINIGNMVALCTKAIQEQQEQIEELKKEIEELKNE